MIVGDPFKFALWFDTVPNWSSPSFVEGLYVLCIDGNYLIDTADTSFRSVTISGEGGWWGEKLKKIQGIQGFDISSYSNEHLFMSADYPLYECDYEFTNKEYNKNALLEKIPTVALTPMEVGDNGWKLYFFSDPINMKDIIIYANIDTKITDVQRKEFDFGYISEVVKNISEMLISKGC